MGTEVYHKSYLPGYYTMRENTEDSNSSSWPLFYADKTFTNGHYYNGFTPRTVADAYPGYDKDALKQKMLEHEAIFKDQVYELHRLYRRQRYMMEEAKRKDFHNHRISIDTSSSSSHLPSHIPSEDARKWQIPSFPSVNPNCGRPSLFGAELTDSPLSCTKGSCSKDCEALECQPTKVRKKLFDLQLPADEYIDTEEQFQDKKTLDVSSYPRNENHRVTPKNSAKFLEGGGRKKDCFRDVSSDRCLRDAGGLADLNEPIPVEEADMGPASVDFLGRSAGGGEFRGSPHLLAKPASECLGLPHEHFPKCQNEVSKGGMSNLTICNKNNGRDWLSYMREAGNGKSDMNFTSPFLQPEKLHIPSNSMQHMHSNGQKTPGIFPLDHIRVDPWRDRAGSSSEVSEKILDHSNYNYPVPVVPSHMSSSYPFVNSADTTNMSHNWSHSVSSWGKPSSSLTHKLASVQTNPSYLSSGTLYRSSLSSPQGHEIFEDKRFAYGNSRLNITSGGDLPTRNGFYHGSSSGSKEPPACVPTPVAPEHLLNHGSQKLFKGSDIMELRSMKDMNLNLNIVQNLCNESVPQQGHGIIEDKKRCEDHNPEAVLPWLRAKPVSKNDAFPNQFFGIGMQNLSSVSSDHVVGVKEREDCSSNRKILGFPIFGNHSTSKNESSSLISTSASLPCPPEGENKQKEMRHQAIDINVAFDSMFYETGKQVDVEALVVEKKIDVKAGSLKNQFDLNSCLTEDGDLVTQSVKSTSANVRIRVEIDLEAPFIPEPEEATLLEEDSNKQLAGPYEAEQQEDKELLKVAAEAIVAISGSGLQHLLESTSDKVVTLEHHCLESTQEEVICLDDPLLWFVEVVSSCVENFDRKSENSSCDEMDDFEAMTLELKEMTEEEYMPQPFLPEIPEVEEAGASSLPNRPRRGQARRGRPRRDFQRDILPGLTSLARHEVTEDLQIFAGLMRATGHAWNSGVTRRNGGRGGGRGRRRTFEVPPPPLMEQLNNIGVGLAERGLTAGWGKTPRRPRRQRCAAGNAVAVQLT